MAAYRAITHFKVRKGREQEGLQFVKDLVVSAKANGALETELLVSKTTPNSLVKTGVWEDMDAANDHMIYMESQKTRIFELFDETPKREMLKITARATRKKRRG